MEHVFEQCIVEARQAGRTVLLASHILAEVEKLADRLSIIREGRIVETGTLSDLRLLSRTRVEADLARPSNGLARMPGVHDMVVSGSRVTCHVETDQLAPVLRYLSDHGVRSLVSQPPSLEELFLRHYRAGSPAAADGGLR
jgi:ABC-2 type transport system ATP-binding protein